MNLRSPSIVTRVTKTTQLTARDWDEIWLLTSEFYDVERELRRRRNCDAARASRCFAWTMRCSAWPPSISTRTNSAASKLVVVLHTSHVLIREAWRGRNLLQKLGARTFLATRLRYPLRPIYWFFDTLSYKSYLLLPRNFRISGRGTISPRRNRRRRSSTSWRRRRYGPAWRPGARGGGSLRAEAPAATAAPLVLGSGHRSGAGLLRARQSGPRRTATCWFACVR